MRELHTHLNTIFTWMLPELMVNSILQNTDSLTPRERERTIFSSASTGPTIACYAHCAREHHRELSEDELRQFYWSLRQRLEEKKYGGIFSLLAEYGERNLLFSGSKPLFRQIAALDWRSISHNIGQDLFTCSLLARRDVQENCVSTSFTWPPIIQTDNRALQSMLKRGFSENHFHLHGSTQIFSLAWGFLMNHPDKTDEFFSDLHFQENLKATINQGAMDNAMPWKIRIYYAAWIRAFLFIKLYSREETDEDTRTSFAKFANSLNMQHELMAQVESLRFSFGEKLPMPNKQRNCLDYAITPAIAQANLGPYRFLAGERNFLYQCFRRCFDGSFLPEDQDLLYLYLLLQIQFRGEMVQSNGRVGFHNFSSYQRRKADGWGMMPEYWKESRNLSVIGTLASEVESLEMRIMPETSPVALCRRINENDETAAFYRKWEQPGWPDEEFDWTSHGEDPQSEQLPYFYVIHFHKRALERIDKEAPPFLQPRNSPVRKKACKQAKSLATALEQTPELCGRIRGIDAASNEISCRPETFATEFRYLRRFCPRPGLQDAQKNRKWPLLSATYHAGEDFLDLTDGLRAIDEAIQFLCLESGDRLGHALALGIDPDAHYKQKAQQSILPKQDLLDNLVWLLHRSVEFGISIQPDLQVKLKQRAELLFRELYCSCFRDGATLYDYYNSWMLRGDHPDLYEVPSVSDVEKAIERCRSPELNEILPYSGFKITSHQNSTLLDSIRKDERVINLLFGYHYDPNVRCAGQVITSFSVELPFIQLLRDIQDRMMADIMERGISIECNPTSNYLIGTFQRYDQHPIFRFNNYGLKIPTDTMPSAQLRVSVNTDDLGVFGTSLENEYALLMCCLQMQQDQSGQRIFSDDAITTYLDHIRCMGNEMVFPEASCGPLQRTKR